MTLSPSNPGPFQDAGINQAALDALAAAAAKYPANDTTTGDQLNTGGFRFNAPTPTTLNSHVAKFDFNINSHQIAFFRLKPSEQLRAKADTAAVNVEKRIYRD